jgi:hypothetical protein
METVKSSLDRAVGPDGPDGAAEFVGRVGRVAVAVAVAGAGAGADVGTGADVGAVAVALVGKDGTVALVGLVRAVPVVRGVLDLLINHCKAASSSP